MTGSLVRFFSLLDVLGVSFLHEGEGDTLSLRKRDSWGLSVSNNLNVEGSSGEDSALGVSDVSNVEGTWMSLDGLQHTDSADVVSAGDNDGGSVDELDNSIDLLGLDVELNKIAFRLIKFTDYY